MSNYVYNSSNGSTYSLAQKVSSTIDKLSEKTDNYLINECPNDRIEEFITICEFDQKELKKNLIEWAKANFAEENIIEDNGYILIKGDVPVLLTAHMDTVHKELIKDFYIFSVDDEGTYITSPEGIGGDDRCGIYMITSLVANGYRPWILFCEDEEVGGVGSNKFVRSDNVKLIKDLKFFIELDRANADDAVFYDCGNKDFKKWIEKFDFKNAYGSFSDISHLSPATDTASVNLSCGYYKAHTTDEYVVWEEMIVTIDKVGKILDAVIEDKDLEKFDYQDESVSYRYFNRSYGYGGYYGGYYDDYDEYSGFGSKAKDSKKKARKGLALLQDVPTTYTGWFVYTDEEGYEEYEQSVEGDSKLACIAKFLIETNIKWEQVLDYYFDEQ